MPHLPDLPLTDPVLVFAVAMALFVAIPQLFERARVPGLIGLILAGAAIGPNGLGVLERDATIVLLGTVGLVYLMFLVGLELDLVEFTRHRRQSVAFGILSFALPQVAGTSLSLALGYPLAASLLLGAMFASHTLVAYPIASRLGIVKTGAATTVLGATLLTDMLALLVLALVTGAGEGATGVGLWLPLVATLGAYVAAVLLLVPRLGRWFFRRAGGDGTSEFVFVLALLFGFAGFAELVGIEPIIGALLVGFGLNRLVPDKGRLMSRIRFTADALFVPFFLLSVGMLVDLRAFGDRTAWLTIGALVLGTVASKAVAAKLTQRLFGLDADDGWVMFGLSVSHAAATMAITLVGYEAGLFDESIVNAIVVVILVTCLVGPWVVERSGRRVALREERKPYEPASAPQRILIPLANPRTSDALLDLAILLRRPGSTEPLHPLMVVRETGGGAEGEVAAAEQLLGHAVNRAVEAEVPVIPLTRVDPNVASGIARAVTETRSSVVVLGWDGGRAGAGEWIFGSVLDQVLVATPHQVVVARLGHPLVTTRRLVVVLPPLIDRHPGILEALAAAKRLASQLGTALVALAMDDGAGACERHLDAVKPAMPLEVIPILGWDALLAHLRKELRPDDLVLLLGARRGTLPWHPKLERLPAQLALLVPESFAILYPPQALETIASAPDFATELAADRVVRLEAGSFGTALAALVEHVTSDPRDARDLRRTLVASELAFSNEIIPGVLLPHARLAGLREPVLVLGISETGLVAPGAAAPVHLVFLLVSPTERPEAHLVRLADVARFLRSRDRVADLLRRHGASTDWLLRPRDGAA